MWESIWVINRTRSDRNSRTLIRKKIRFSEGRNFKLPYLRRHFKRIKHSSPRTIVTLSGFAFRAANFAQLPPKFAGSIIKFRLPCDNQRGDLIRSLVHFRGYCCAPSSISRRGEPSSRRRAKRNVTQLNLSSSCYPGVTWVMARAVCGYLSDKIWVMLKLEKKNI